MVFTEDELKSLLKEWQAILRMQDWNIYLKVKRHYDMPDGIGGNCDWRHSKKVAWINILEPSDINPEVIDKNDTEVILVHEMLHPLIGQFESEDSCREGSAERYLKEQTLDILARSLVNLKRRGDPNGPQKEKQEEEKESGG